MKTEVKNGLLVNFLVTKKEVIQWYLEHSDFYGYEVEDNIYLFPSDVIDYDFLEKALTSDFNRYGIYSFDFEGV